jgi:hypothetical protein
MEFIIVTIFFTVAVVLGITIVTQDGMVLYKLREEAENNGSKLLEPLILCEWCMPSIYSMLGYVFSYILYGWDIKYLLFYPIVISLSSLICGLVWGICRILIHKLKKINYENENDIQRGKQESIE